MIQIKNKKPKSNSNKNNLKKLILINYLCVPHKNKKLLIKLKKFHL